MKKLYFPIYTQVSEKPIVITEKLPSKVFDYPFFNDAVPLVRSMNSNRKKIDLSAESNSVNVGSLKLKGFIFHTSHCGSTLLANMLGASKKTRIVSETEAINGLLISKVFYNLEETMLLKSLKTIIDAYLQSLGEAEQLIFKLSSWNVFFINLFQKAYPEVPWIFIDRKTEEVVQSLSKSGLGFVEWFYHPTPILQKYFLGENVQTESFEDYLSAMVEAHKNGAEKARSGKKLVVSYPSFLNEFENKILPHFSLKYSKIELLAAQEIKKYDAKSISKTRYSNLSS
ncbi:hypothetical protein [Aequorivita antarctica]|uniref:Sulfotransferase family protein n=1 Tax=Aequorivita antarctica TaxID=153266 RepID=A0A5C6YZ98_9FLAO|nr:hypothetical protein [Aequorivita antarctica]TXD73063.1 hypothetical protein ESU54_10445 [Aequorivita antarctica]SRX76187.1 hypothetical protein AEQU3_03186 [Aequorivita antarctica]